MMAMLIVMARSEFKTDDSIATPCSVNANGKYFKCWPLFKVTICDLKESASLSVSSNRKSTGNLTRFLLTACFKTFVGTS